MLPRHPSLAKRRTDVPYVESKRRDIKGYRGEERRRANRETEQHFNNTRICMLEWTHCRRLTASTPVNIFLIFATSRPRAVYFSRFEQAERASHFCENEPAKGIGIARRTQNKHCKWVI